MKNILLLALFASLAACTQHYYRITDLGTGDEYFTKAWLPGLSYGQCGGIGFRDLGTGDEVRLPTSRIHRVTEEEALHAIGRK